MRRYFILPMLVLAMTMTSCDFMRKMAGRPTADEMETLKEEMGRIEQLRLEEARIRTSLDSLELVRQVMTDSIANLQATAGQVAAAPVVRDLSHYATPHLENRYYIIIGAFQTYENAKALMRTADQYGYSPVLVACRNGLLGVGVCPVDKYEDALKAIKILRREKFCPADIWIYTNR